MKQESPEFNPTDSGDSLERVGLDLYNERRLKTQNNKIFMKLKSVLTITTLLLLSIIGAGAASAYIGYKMGETALKGVSQPEDNPTRKLANRQQGYRKPQPFKPLDEKTILTKVYNQKYHHNKQAKKGKVEEKSKSEAKKNDKAVNPSTFPLKNTNNNVTLEVSQVKQEGGDILVLIGLTNQGQEAVKFLYSFLEVADSKGQALGAIVEDLPETIPANGKKIEGQIRIPITLTEDSESLSLNLSDYPDQKRKLVIKEIPLPVSEVTSPETEKKTSENPEEKEN
jgi:hypothetical protein